MKTSRGWMIWAALALCAALVLGAMGWLTRGMLASERDRAEAEAKADLEERTRLALWRMDAEGSSILLAENRIPPRDYQSPGILLNGNSAILPPAAATRDPLIHLHFEASGNRPLTSPEALPTGSAEKEESARIAVMQAKLERLTGILTDNPLPLDNGQLLRCAVAESEATWNALPKEALQEKTRNISLRQEKGGLQSRREPAYQTDFNETERAQRAKAVEQSLNNSFESSEVIPAAQARNFQVAPRPQEIQETGAMRAAWIGGELFLLRQVSYSGSPRDSPTVSGGLLPADLNVVQGAWLDAELLRERLLAEVTDLLPAASLAASPGAAGLATASVEDTLALVSFPFRLERNESIAAATGPISGPLKVGWIAVLVALAAAAWLVRGIMRLSERRASFVSAVTHELRTPLTTFQIYSDMLQSGAVKEEHRGEYFRTLHREAGRLSHLVENVLAFSRIERGSARAAPAAIAAGELVRPMLERFGERLQEAGLRLSAELDHAAWRTVVQADPAAVEHVLFNLIDNAAKYAAGTSPPEVRIEAETGNRVLSIIVRDHGPGIAPAERKRVFRAFHKSAAAAAESRPGVGLGLALSRRLARAGGGDLVLRKSDTGTCFVLSLPLHRH